MSDLAAHRRGRPLAALGLVLGGWTVLRAVAWEPPFALPDAVFQRLVERASTIGPNDPRAAVADAGVVALETVRTRNSALGLPAALRRPTPAALLPLDREAHQPLAGSSAYIAAGHQLLYLAALGRLPLPAALVGAATARAPLLQAAPPPLRARRWSGDGWLLLREGSGGLTAAAGSPAYGASQAGGVLRYSLAPSSPRVPQAYLRLSRAIGGLDDAEVAAGLSLRPLAAISVRLLGEARVQRSAGPPRVRPAASLVTEFAPVPLPLSAQGEFYAQAGYVGGKNATPFFDAQAVVDRQLVSTGPAELRLGAGAWAAGQEGAARLDLGPRASLRLRLGETASRVALDWRFRVAGNARPASGPALTFSAGF